MLPSGIAFFPHEVDHVIAEKHGGKTEAENLAFACWRCNRCKGSDLGSFDPQTGNFSLLFNPRAHVWSDHFVFQDDVIIGLSPQGRTTINLLRLNSEERLAECNLLRDRLQEPRA
jgi:hypothetical protein